MSKPRNIFCGLAAVFCAIASLGVQLRHLLGSRQLIFSEGGTLFFRVAFYDPMATGGVCLGVIWFVLLSRSSMWKAARVLLFACIVLLYAHIRWPIVRWTSITNISVPFVRDQDERLVVETYYRGSRPDVATTQLPVQSSAAPAIWHDSSLVSQCFGDYGYALDLSTMAFATLAAACNLRRPKELNSCQYCGYSRIGLVGAVCPECGCPCQKHHPALKTGVTPLSGTDDEALPP
jgi:hypothetical protein